MNAKNWKFSYKENGKQELKQHILDTFSLWGAIGLLWYSFLSIIKEHFPEFLEVIVEAEPELDKYASSFVGEPTYVTYGMDWLVIGAFLVVLWLGYDWPKKYLKKLALPFHLAGAVIPIAYVGINFEKVADGVVRLAWFYLPKWNAYYKQNLYMGIASNDENAVVAFTVICMILWWLVWAFAYAIKRRVALVLFTVLALSVELLVGISPKEDGLLFAFFGAMLLVTLGSTSVIKRAAAIAGVALSLVLTGVFFDSDIKALATTAKKQEILALQKNFTWDNLLNLIQIDFHFNWEKLGNHTPKYTGKIVLEIESDTSPVKTVYIKGFYGTNYENGNWNYDDSAFKEACKDAGKSPEEVAQQIFQMPYDRWKEYYKDSSLSKDITYDIFYTGTTGDVAYVPYVSDYASLDETYTFMGDYLLKKSIWDTQITASSINTGIELGDWWNINCGIEKGFGRYQDPSYSSYYTTEIELTEEEKELEFLNGLSAAYLQVSDDAKEFLSEASAELERRMKRIESVDLIDGFSYSDSENYHRIRYGKEVVSYLAEQMSYSLKLDELSAGVDPIAYALKESHEGYCMHFASAATLLLRQGGVPARYVSGYAVDISAFTQDEENGIYKAQVGDFMAHAWVEVYLDNIGWVHLEATPGSSLENLPTQSDINRWESEAEAQRAEHNKQPVSPSESEESEQPTEDTEETQETENTQTELKDPINSEEQTTTESENSQNQGGVGNGEGDPLLDGMRKTVGIVGASLLVLIAVFISGKYGVDRYRKALTDEIDSQMTRKAVKRINRRLYRNIRLWNPKLWVTGKMSDILYEEALKKQYPQVSNEEWKRFMEIVKKNHYSDETVTVEEMHYCYTCYQSCAYKKRK